MGWREWLRSKAARPAGAAPDGPASKQLEVVASAVRSAILQAVAERCPAGWRCLVLSPPPHPDQMTWHVHLAATVALDLADGRTVPTAPPPESQEWALPSGRVAGLAGGDPAPAPGPETRAVRVTGAYLTVRYRAEPPPSFEVGLGDGSTHRHRFRAPADDPGRLAPLLEEAIGAAIGGHGRHPATAMGYSPASWQAHGRSWIVVHGR